VLVLLNPLHNLRLSAVPLVDVADADEEVWGFIALLLFLLLLFCSMGELTLHFSGALAVEDVVVECLTAAGCWRFIRHGHGKRSTVGRLLL